MAIQTEYREFFLRAVQVSSGAKADQETGFATQYQVVDCDGNVLTAFNRFLKNHFPSEDVFKKLFESIAFKLNPEDTASTEQQALVRIAIGENVVNRVDTDGGFTTVVVPTTLPKVSAASGAPITVTPIIRRSSDDAIVGSITPGDRVLYYVDYELSTTAKDNINDSSILVDFDSTTVDQGTLTAMTVVALGTGTALQSVVVAADTLETDGDYIELQVVARKVDPTSAIIPPTLALVRNVGVNIEVVGYEIYGPGTTPSLVDTKACDAFATIRLYRVGATGLKYTQTVAYHNATIETESKFVGMSATETIDWSVANTFTLFADVITTGMNAAEPFAINSYAKSYID